MKKAWRKCNQRLQDNNNTNAKYSSRHHQLILVWSYIVKVRSIRRCWTNIKLWFKVSIIVNNKNMFCCCCEKYRSSFGQMLDGSCLTLTIDDTYFLVFYQNSAEQRINPKNIPRATIIMRWLRDTIRTPTLESLVDKEKKFQGKRPVKDGNKTGKRRPDGISSLS